jgi:regulatory protein
MQNKKLTFTVEEAKRKLENYCVYQDRSHKEIEQKLLDMKMVPEAREVIILHLIEHDFLNEERFSKSFARGKFSVKKWGRIRIIRELKIRSISEYNIDQALREIHEEEYLKTLKSLAQKKYISISDKNPYKKCQKTTNFLLYRGFENNLVYDMVKEVSNFGN